MDLRSKWKRKSVVSIRPLNRQEAFEYSLVVWLVSPFVCSTVHQPGHVQNPSPTEHCGDEPRVRECLTPAVHWNHCWEEEASDWHQEHVVSGMRNAH